MAEARKASQIPTQQVVLPYTETYGAEAIGFYNESKNTAQEWQEIQLNNILAYDNEGLWLHSSYGYSVPRRNGKGEVLIIRELWGLMNGEHMLHTAHLATTSSSASYRLAKCLDDMGYEEVIRVKKGIKYEKHYVFHKQYGLERITLLGDNGGDIRFRTRTSKGGLGEGADLLIIDEAQEYTNDQESTLKYIVSSSKNPQIILTGTPPTAISTGTVFKEYRKNILQNKLEFSGWAEWSVESETDPNDVESWYKTNPSLGVVFTERIIKKEIGSDNIDFNIQRLGLWYEQSLSSAINENEWNALKEDKPKFKNHRLFVGIKFGKDGTNVALSIATKTADDRIFVEVVNCKPMRDGITWIVDWLCSAQNVQKVAVDGQNGQTMLTEAMRQAKLKKPILPTVKEIVNANAIFEQAIFKETLCHSGQEPLKEVVSHTEKRAIGNNGGFGYKSQSEQLEIALLDSCMIAHWLCSEDKEMVQRVRD